MVSLVELKNMHRRSRRFLRALAGRDTFAASQIHGEKVVLGNDRAQWCVCPLDLSANSVVYAFGVGEDVSFELELVRRFGLQVHAFDPTPRSIRWVQSRQWPGRFIFHDYGVADYDGTANFSPPDDPSHVSYSAIRNRGGSAVQAPVYCLHTIMKMLKHEALDVLKMDIEGFEYRVLEDLLRSSLRPKQLLVEFHHRWREIGVRKTKKLLSKLEREGYRRLDVSPSGEEYSLIHTTVKDLSGGTSK